MEFQQFQFLQKLQGATSPNGSAQMKGEIPKQYMQFSNFSMSEDKENMNPSQRSLEQDPFSFFQNQISHKLPNQTLASNDPSSILKIQAPGSVIHQVEFYNTSEGASCGNFQTEGDDLQMNPQLFLTAGSQEQQVQIDPSIQAMFSPGFQEQVVTQEEDESSSEFYMGANQQQQQFSPEYMQLFSQFYQMFMNMQQQNDPQNQNSVFMQMMARQFMQQQNQPGQFNNEQQQFDYNNLPLASIPETKDSMLEEQSNWGQGGNATAKTNKVDFRSARGSIGNSMSYEQCTCCCTCRSRKASIYQPCSNFNLEQQQFSNQKQDFSRHTALGQNVMSPGEVHGVNGQSQVVESYIKNMDQIASNFSSHQRMSSMGSSSGGNIIQQFMPQTQTNFKQIISRASSPTKESNLMSPVPGQHQQLMLSPRDQQQTKLIEYMIDNNDFSNYKSRGGIIKDRSSRTLSRSQSKNSTLLVAAQSHRPADFFQLEQAPPTSNCGEQMCFSNVKGLRSQRDSMHQEQFFLSPQVQTQSQNQNRSRKVADKVKEIRRMNKQNGERGKSKKLKNSKSNAVFEIKDLKKGPKQTKQKQAPQAQSNMETFNFVRVQPEEEYQYATGEQSSYQEQFFSNTSQPLKQQQQPQLDMREEEEVTNPYTFKSLASVWKKSNTQQVSMIKENELSEVGSNHFDIISDAQRPPELPLEQQPVQQQQRKPPGVAVHLIRKPQQNEEYKKIQERLTQYYNQKTQGEVVARHKNFDLPVQQQQQDDTLLSMTKTLSSFKSLMMRTMSQISVNQDHNMQKQYVMGAQQNHRKPGTRNETVNISSIQDDTNSIEMSENLTKLISPRNLYNGQNGRNPRKSHEPSKRVFPVKQQEPAMEKGQKGSSCLPNALFFRGGERQGGGSLCCGKAKCGCGGEGENRGDLLGHFQNFLCEMDRQSHRKKSQGFRVQSNRESIAPSPINKLLPTSPNDYVETNLKFIGRPSSQTSRYCPSNRQSMSTIGGGGQNDRMKRLSSGSAFSGFGFNQSALVNVNNQPNQMMQHYYAEGRKPTTTKDQSKSPHSQWNSISPSHSTTQIDQNQSLEKLDTNKEEELRLANYENALTQQVFIEKSHRLNLQEQQRKELMARISKHKLGGVQSNTSQGGITQSTSHVGRSQNDETRRSVSLEDRRKVEKFKKNLERIKQQQEEVSKDLTTRH